MSIPHSAPSPHGSLRPGHPHVEAWIEFLRGGLAKALIGGLLISCGPKPSLYTVVLPNPLDSTPAANGSVLFVLSAATELQLRDGTSRPTGTFLGEFFETHSALAAEGYQTVIATPEGQRPAIDPESLKEKYWEEHPLWLEKAQSFLNSSTIAATPLSLGEAFERVDTFQGIVVPGGQGVMVDLLENALLHRLLARFATTHRPVGLICHAPALLTYMPRRSNPLLGRRVTSVSGLEELYIETVVMGAEARVREIGAGLQDHGFMHHADFPGSSNAIRDCNLVTSQNPFSGREFNELFLLALTEWRRGARCVVKP